MAHDARAIAFEFWDPEGPGGDPEALQAWLWHRATGAFERIDGPPDEPSVGHSLTEGFFADGRVALVRSAYPILPEPAGEYWVPVAP